MQLVFTLESPDSRSHAGSRVIRRHDVRASERKTHSVAFLVRHLTEAVHQRRPSHGQVAHLVRRHVDCVIGLCTGIPERHVGPVL